MVTPNKSRPYLPRQMQSGVSLVEFAFILPIVLALVLGALTYSAALYNKSVMAYATRQAVRAWVVTKPLMSKFEVEAAARSYCQYILLVGRSYPCVPTAIGPDVPAPGDTLTVAISLDFSGLYIFGGLAIHAQTSMAFE